MKRLAVVVLAFLGVLLVPARPASAHPLGNFTVNQYEGLTLYPDRVEVIAAEGKLSFQVPESQAQSSAAAPTPS